MDRHNVWRVTGSKGRPTRDHRWRGSDRARYRPAQQPVAIDRPRAEQTWPAPLQVRSSPPRMVPNDAHPEWPGRDRPAVPAYQRRLDRLTDGIVRSYRVHQQHRTVAGRRRGLTTHRRPLAVMGKPVTLGRGDDAHYLAIYASTAPEFRRFRMGGERSVGERGEEMATGIMSGMRPQALISPRSAVIAMVAVIVLLMSTVGSGLAQQRYVVQPGDTLDSIAQTFGVDPEAIRRSSYMPDPNALEAGQVIVIPDPGQSPSEAAQMAAELEGTSPWVQSAHWVEYGDTLASIGASYGHDPGALAEFNGIEDPASIMPGDRILIPPVRDGSEMESASASGPVTVPNVVTYKQQRNLSCEYASVHIATSMLGNGIEEHVYIDSMPITLNPHNGYRGNIDGWWGNTDDYGIYAAPLVPVLNDYGYAGEVFYSMGDADQLIAHIDAGHPVVVWLGFWGDTRERLHDDGTYSVAAGTHVVTAYGYDDAGVYVSDPATASLDFYSWGEFIEMWRVLDGMSLAVYPA